VVDDLLAARRLMAISLGTVVASLIWL